MVAHIRTLVSTVGEMPRSQASSIAIALAGGRPYNAVMTEQTLVRSREWAEAAFDIADDGQASNIVLLDVREACDFSDYFVIMTAESTRQLRALVEDVEVGMKPTGAALHHVEGTHQSGWILMDYGDVLVHLMGPDQRDFYGLETVWPRARQLRVIP